MAGLQEGGVEVVALLDAGGGQAGVTEVVVSREIVKTLSMPDEGEVFGGHD